MGRSVAGLELLCCVRDVLCVVEDDLRGVDMSMRGMSAAGPAGDAVVVCVRDETARSRPEILKSMASEASLN